jgi:sulfhydrogenase subunit beta (sulfur reductase)
MYPDLSGRPEKGLDRLAASTQAVLAANQIETLIEALRRRGFDVIGPTVRDGAIIYDHIDSASDLPAGVSDEQAPGHYRLKKRDDPALFGYAVGPHSGKKYFHRAEVRLWSAERQDSGFRILNNEAPAKGPYALVGVRACELAAIQVQDRVLLGDKYRDPLYARSRDGAFIIAVHCTQAAATCFCVSMGTGPRASQGFDLALTEIATSGEHRFLAEAATERGSQLLAELETRPVNPEDRRAADAALARAEQQTRNLDTAGIKELLYQNFEHPRWDDVAGRCLSCANCTMVCPTCFCTTVEDVTDLTGEHAERWRRWDSCFTLAFSYIHGGSIRTSSKGRYRQWMTHKLASWIDQFGSSGCVGCGRCITWCPVGIDITEEVRAIREGENHGDS